MNLFRRVLLDLALLGSLLWFHTGEVGATQYFPHGAVGDVNIGGQSLSAQASITLTKVQTPKGSISESLVLGAVVSAGSIRFLNSAGEPLTLAVNGQERQSVDYLLNVNSGPLQANFEISSPGGALTAFWAVIEETVGNVSGQLTFAIRDANTQLKLTDVDIFSTPASILNTTAALLDGSEATGLAIANPQAEAVDFWVVAMRDRPGCTPSPDETCLEVAGQTQRQLMGGAQTAEFIQSLFPDLEDEFFGQLVVVCDRELAAAALNQDVAAPSLSLRGSTTLQQNSGTPLPFAVGYLSNLFATSGGAGDGIPAEMGSFYRMATTDSPITGGTIVVRQNGEEIEGKVSPDGAFLLGPLSDGEWEVEIRGIEDERGREFLPIIQRLDFPAPMQDRRMVPLSVVNPGWFSQTLLLGSTLKPRSQLDFYFDPGPCLEAGDQPEGYCALVEEVRQVFESWAVFELPQVGIPVETSSGVRILAADEIYETDVPPNLTAGTIIVRVNTEGSELAGAITHSGDGELVSGFLEFNPQAGESLCESCPERVATLLWAVVFGRVQGSEPCSSLEQGPWPELNPIRTRFCGDARGYSATALDRLYWRFIQERPASTVITSEAEVWPKPGIPAGAGAQALQVRVVRF